MCFGIDFKIFAIAYMRFFLVMSYKIFLSMIVSTFLAPSGALIAIPTYY